MTRNCFEGIVGNSLCNKKTLEDTMTRTQTPRMPCAKLSLSLSLSFYYVSLPIAQKLNQL